MSGTTTPTPGTPGIPGTSGTPTLYFAYGSNLSLTQMALRCPHSQYLALGRLPNYTWLINERGYANIVPTSLISPRSSTPRSSTPRPGTPRSSTPLSPLPTTSPAIPTLPQFTEVWGLVYELDVTPSSYTADESRLDIAEGVPYAYTKEFLDVELYGAGFCDVVNGVLRSGKKVVNCLTYVDNKRVGEGFCDEEYVKRMNRGIRDAVKRGMPEEYVERVIRRFIKAPKEEVPPREVDDPFLGRVGGLKVVTDRMGLE